MQLKDSVWLVTGASSGIGREVACALHRRGARVAMAARGEAMLKRAAQGIGPGVLALPMDVTCDDSVARGVQTLLAQWGRIDGIAQVAGNGGKLKRWSESCNASSREMFAVHVLGAERVLRAALPTLKSQGRGVVVNFASTVAWVPMPGAAAYSAAKSALVALSQCWRAELAAHGIDVRLFAPPHTRTAAGLAWPLPLPKIFDADWVARQFIRMVERDHVRAIPGGNGSLLWLQRLAPGLAQHIMNRIGFEAIRRVEAQR